MKVGQQLPVTVQGIEVAVAVVTHMENGQVTIEFPGTRFVAATRTEIVDTPRESTGAEHIVTGVDVVKPEAVVETPKVVEATPAIDTITNPADTAAVGGALTVDKPETKAETVATNTDAAATQ